MEIKEVTLNEKELEKFRKSLHCKRIPASSMPELREKIAKGGDIMIAIFEALVRAGVIEIYD